MQILDFIFSITNNKKYKIIKILGIKMQFKYKKYKELFAKILNSRYWCFLFIKKFNGLGNAKSYYLSKYIEPVKKITRAEMAKILPDQIDVKSDKVWSMWLQEDIPDIIKMCLDSIKLFYPEIIIITEKNLFEYVDVPNYIWKKYKKGIIKAPHFSDWVRCYLLDKYGGIWLDASILMCDKIPKYITKQKFFILQAPNKKSVSNFFLIARKNNYFIKNIRIFLEEYWKKENFLIDYFFMHKYIILASQKDDVCKQIYKNIIPDINNKIRYLVDNMSFEADEDCWEYLKKTSYMYKINRKDKKAVNNKLSWYNYLLDKWKNDELFTNE